MTNITYRKETKGNSFPEYGVYADGERICKVKRDDNSPAGYASRWKIRTSKFLICHSTRSEAVSEYLAWLERAE